MIKPNIITDKEAQEIVNGLLDSTKGTVERGEYMLYVFSDTVQEYTKLRNWVNAHIDADKEVTNV